MKIDKKGLVLNLLRQQMMPLTLSQIMALSNIKLAERSVRRWLKELHEEGLVNISGSKRSTRYQIFQSSPVILSDEIFSPASRHAINYIHQPLFQRSPTKYQFEWLANYIPNQSFYFQEKQLQSLVQFGARQFQHDRAGTYARTIYNRLLIDLSYNSSRLEGNTYSLLDTERLVLEGQQASDKLNEETIMILNHKEAIRYLVDNATRIKFQVNEILTLHYLLSEGLVPQKYAGNFRDHGVRISSSTYIPLENPEKLEIQLNLIMQKTTEIKNPFEQSLFLLVHIAYLQAFHDVNKRSSRLAANIPLIQQNLVPLSFNDLDKQDYLSAMLAIYECQDVNPLIDLYLQSYQRTAIQYDVTVENVGIDIVRVQYRELRRRIIREIVLQKLIGSDCQNYIEKNVTAEVAKDVQTKVIEHIRTDLAELGPKHIAGMSISKQQLEQWIKLARSK